MSSPQWCK